MVSVYRSGARATIESFQTEIDIVRDEKTVLEDDDIEFKDCGLEEREETLELQEIGEELVPLAISQHF